MEHEFVEETCCNCGCVFMLPKKLQINLRETKNSFYCYNGHGQYYTKSSSEILKEKLERAEREKQDNLISINNLQRRIKELTAPKPKRKAKRVDICQ